MRSDLYPVSNIIRVRHKPDWLRFDLESSRAFLKSVGLNEDLIAEFSSHWDRNFRVDYRQIRAEMQKIALENLAKVEDARIVVTGFAQGELRSAKYIAYVDDDDWFSPRAFSALPPLGDGEDGVRWGSLRLGRSFQSIPRSTSFLEHRNLDHVVYTNNYAIRPGSIDRLGEESFFEHTAAQATFDRHDFVVLQCSDYLSCAVKHPCCTLSARYLMSQDSFRRDPQSEVVAFTEDARSCSPSGTMGWLAEPLARVCDLFEAAL